ncbi:MAG: aspartate aminotransferase family protein [Marinosulfonomonas sp.]
MELENDWSLDEIAKRRDQYFSPGLKKFVPFAKPISFRRGKGQYLWDSEGNKYTDLLGMNVCISVGHAHPDVVAAASAQAQELPHCTTMFYHPQPSHYAQELTATFPKGHDWVVHLTSSGSEAVDLALMMARAFTGTTDFLSLTNAYHGPTAGAQALTGIAGFRHNVAQVPGIAFVPDPNPYRGQFGANTGAYLDAIDQTIKSATSGRIAGMIAETIQGYTGIIEMPQGYLAGAAERVRAAGGLMVIDEVQSGIGRTGDAFWAFESHGIVPDIAVLAKGIGNGYPIGAVVAKRHVAEAMADKFMFHTYGSNPMSAAAARQVLKVIETEKLQENAKTVGAALLARLQDLQQRFDCIGDVRGRGLMLAIEFVKDRGSKTPDPEMTAAVFEGTRQFGVIVSKSGPNRSVLRLVPPLCLSMEDIDPIATAFERCIQTALAS